jgi:hypothetical protein
VADWDSTVVILSSGGDLSCKLPTDDATAAALDVAAGAAAPIAWMAFKLIIAATDAAATSTLVLRPLIDFNVDFDFVSVPAIATDARLTYRDSK